jgi:uncharacterized protein
VIRKFVVAFLLLAVTTQACVHPTSAPAPSQQVSPSPSSSPPSLPKPNSLINDYANVFEPAAKKRLSLLVDELLRDTQVEFAIVTIETTNAVPIFDYSLALARELKPGGPSGRGLLLVLAIKDRQWRLQVSKALEAELPDQVCKQLAGPSVELYAKGKYAEGVDRYIRAIGDHLRSKR